MKKTKSQVYLESLINFEQMKKTKSYDFFKLERMYCLLELLGNPQESFETIHVVGTKGKGSTAVMIEAILREAGHVTGLYTSPHFMTYRERIKVNNRMIPENSLGALLKKIQCVWKAQGESKLGNITFFEALTSAGFLYFQKKGVQYAVVEAGLGARLDATRTADGKYSVITKIAKDHTDILGNTIEKIAKEKIEIISKNHIVVTTSQCSTIKHLIKNKCKKESAELFFPRATPSFRTCSKGKQQCSVTTSKGDYQGIKVPLLGAHQCENASLAINMCEQVLGRKLSVCLINKAFVSVEWKGRFQVVEKNPYVILDGAQNVTSLEVLEKTLQDYFPKRAYHVLFGASSDKDFSEYNGNLFNNAQSVILTSTGNPRSYELAKLRKHLSPVLSLCVKESKDYKIAFKTLRNSINKNELILITGSLYLLGNILTLFPKNPIS